MDNDTNAGPAVASTGLLATLRRLQDESMDESRRADDNALLMQYHLGRHDTYRHAIELLGGVANVPVRRAASASPPVAGSAPDSGGDA